MYTSIIGSKNDNRTTSDGGLVYRKCRRPLVNKQGLFRPVFNSTPFCFFRYPKIF